MMVRRLFLAFWIVLALAAPAEAGTLNVLYGFNSSDSPNDQDGFTSTAGAASTLSWVSTDLAGAGASGSLQSSISGRSKSNSNKWTLTTTWHALGVPSGNVVTAVTSGTMKSKCTTYTTGAASTSGAVTVVDGATTITVSASRSFSATDASPVSTSGTNASRLALPAADSITITINNALNTGNSSSANVVLLQDELAFTITYKLGAHSTLPMMGAG